MRMSCTREAFRLQARFARSTATRRSAAASGTARSRAIWFSRLCRPSPHSGRQAARKMACEPGQVRRPSGQSGTTVRRGSRRRRYSHTGMTNSSVTPSAISKQGEDEETNPVIPSEAPMNKSLCCAPAALRSVRRILAGLEKGVSSSISNGDALGARHSSGASSLHSPHCMTRHWSGARPGHPDLIKNHKL